LEKWDPIKNAAKPTTPAKTLVPPPMPATPVADAADPVAVEAAPPVAAEPSILGPQTQALKDKQAAKKAILAETAAKLKAVDTGVVDTGVAETAVAEPVATVAAKPAAKPRAPRKTKKAEEA